MNSVVFVHAHPDDEAIWTGGTIAALVRRGVQVTVITCTMGELGEVIGEPYQGLVAGRADQLGGFRVRELTEALTVLGANGPSHQPIFLGGAGYWRDSGMLGDPGNDDPRAFINSGDRAVAQLRVLLDDLQPDLVITYDADGGYGHPDHIRAHDITVAACGDNIPTAWAVTDHDTLAAGLAAITVVPEQWHSATIDDFASVTGEYGVVLDDAALSAKIRALEAHATQAWVGNGSMSHTNPHAAWGSVDDSGRARGVWALSNLLCQPLVPMEHYRRGTAENLAILGDE
ncbi:MULTISPECIES: N-acetyl-1-D-myo-inositol-2-amino-2-deoxy-alpha-D-glucopyranoside deacetylase [unclassified Corynebacterium]|uniref:N-acetyl-1-D-myo-inositol-2-amino-2-deoxy-alpha- D-glucopyranoside deacetylase n=1 Tax=unclassified Corynebacterium TaxID=2624378 RepID=UPI00309BBFE2